MRNALLKMGGLAALAILLNGCGPTLRNLTPEEYPANASGIYTLSMVVQNTKGKIDRTSFKPQIVIDGQTFPMKPSEVGPFVYDFDFVMPEGRREAKYYYLLDYIALFEEGPVEKQAWTQLQELRLLDRYVLSLVNTRGPVGASIPVVGQGFTAEDRVVIGGQEAPTQYVSSNALTFTVPQLTEGREYSVALVGPDGTRSLGEFRVDASRLKISPNPLQLTAGERSTMVIAMDQPAPTGGLLVEVTTDRPKSIIMPEVVIPAGARSVSVPVEGGQPGRGTLYLRARGFDQRRISLVVRSGWEQSPNKEEAATQIMESPGS